LIQYFSQISQEKNEKVRKLLESYYDIMCLKENPGHNKNKLQEIFQKLSVQEHTVLQGKIKAK
jgi:hypothetical protein